jgi:predicted enzyme related to lactoylglutathione lyase
MPEGTGAAFEWRDLEDSQKKGMTVWGTFPQHTKYFGPSRSGFMINYRVDDLDASLKALKEEGVEIDPHREDYDYGRFAWIMDPEGNRIERWEPKRKVVRPAGRGLDLNSLCLPLILTARYEGDCDYPCGGLGDAHGAGVQHTKQESRSLQTVH